eukprot:611404-Rhodomonas_salina.2
MDSVLFFVEETHRLLSSEQDISRPVSCPSTLQEAPLNRILRVQQSLLRQGGKGPCSEDVNIQLWLDGD